ncbi:MAG: fatty acid desaturase [Gammaproteobacteria bacterium]|nr:fatty acid desaturase [Gammaproteobacteria bacterium]
MQTQNSSAASSRRSTANRWPGLLGKYRKAQPARAAGEVAITALAFVLCWTLMLIAVERGLSWLYVLALVPGAGFIVRLFLIQHDCGHGSLFPNQRVNNWIGRIIGVVTLTPYEYWRRSHAVHHASSGNLDRRGIGDLTTLTVAEYRASSRWGRIRYWLYRHPVVMFGIGPLYQFVLQHRIPLGFMRDGWWPWLSAIGTNAAIFGSAAAMIWAVGATTFFMVHVPLVILGSGVGVWLFYIQHQFEDTHWADGKNWSAQEAALYGSSHYDLPKALRWMTANIGLHHVHHLSSRIPFYRLPEVLRDHAEFRDLNRITLSESIGALRLVLWDERVQRLVSFKQLRAEAAGSAA